ncbi:MAG TPA: isoprenylcysteine carboxylmethyltransferase family protein [Anaerolineales bacterium]|jgi:protein-S-isoprenylcysteine O-methyltransferase Ste14
MPNTNFDWTTLLPGYFAALTVLLMMGMVLTRVMLMRRNGIEAMHFGKMDRKDFLIPPFAFLYFYLIFAAAFNLPSLSRQKFFNSAAAPWGGVLLCLAGLLLLSWSLVSFGKSFRVGIDAERPDKLITTGVFALSRNPIYVAFGAILLGQFLIFSNWILLVYLVLGFWLLNRQVLLEEDHLKQHYGQEYLDYCKRVRRYL